MYHTTKDGNVIKIKDLELSHLQNIIKWIERKAEKGMVVLSGGGTDADDMWIEKEIIKGEEVLEYMNYYAYVKELKKRKCGTNHLSKRMK